MEQEPLQHADTWAAQTFRAAELGDPRRADRLIKIANALAENPSASLPHDARDLGGNAGGISFSEQPCIRV
jgi:hypothetical protein